MTGMYGRPRGGLEAEDAHQHSTAAARSKVLWKAALLAESLQKTCDHTVEIRIPFPEILDLPDGVNDGRVVFSTEASPDFRERRAGE
jgi:hypothetical protein